MKIKSMHFFFPLATPAGPIATAEWHYIQLASSIMLIVAIPTLATLYIFAWKYRAKRNEKKEQTHVISSPGYFAWREVVLWIVPIAVVSVLSVFVWRSAHAIDPYASIPANEAIAGAKPLTVEVIALPWKWLFIYPAQGIATVNFLEFPAGTPVRFDLTADGPMSTFWIPQLGTEVGAMAGMQTQLNLLASGTGDYGGKDTEINGAGYSGMTFAVNSVSPDEFTGWVASVKASTSTLTAASYAALAAPSSYTPVSYYASVDPALYGTVLMQYMMPMRTGSATGTAMPGMTM